jgi:MATE family multidrug resistance protein
MGVLGVVNTFVSQHLGAGRAEKGAAYAWAGLWLSLAAWALVLLPYALAFPWAYALMRDGLGLDPVSAHVGAMEATYGRIMLGGMILTLAARTLGHYFYGVHRPFVVMSGTLAGNAVNLAVSYALIQWTKAGGVSIEALLDWDAAGPLEPAVAHGALRGAAIGTVVGLLVEAAIPAVVFLSPASRRTLGTLAAWRPSWPHIRDLLRLGWPGGVMFGNEMVCWWIFMGGFVASFDRGSGVVTHGHAGWITHQYLMISFMPAVGISIATTAIVGKCIGAGRHDLAQARTWLALRLTLAYMGMCALAFVLFGPAMARVFIQDGLDPAQADEIVRLATWMLVLAATFQLFDGMAITLSGALRGAGDTVWPGVATIILSWGLIVGGGWLATRFLPGLSSFGPWAAASLYIIALSLALLWRFLGGHWKTIKVLGPEAGEGVEGGRPVLASDCGPGDLAMAPGLDIPQGAPDGASGPR